MKKGLNTLEPFPVTSPPWLTWNCGCVRNIAAGILARRAWGEAAILEDAVVDTNCHDLVLPDHLRAPRQHLSTCWPLRLLTETPIAGRAEGGAS